VDGSPRNLVGSLMLIACGAAEMPYAGPVVITGWVTSNEGDITDVDTRVLPVLAQMRACIAEALDGVDSYSCPLCTPQWRDGARAMANFVATAPAPGLAFLAGDDALAALRAAAQTNRAQP
jgi:hypothetical protein